MNPTNSSQGGDELGPVGSSTPQQSAQTTTPTPQTQDHQVAAVNVIRGQIDALYGDRSIDTGEPRQTTVAPRIEQPYQAQQPTQPVQSTQQPDTNVQPSVQEAQNPYQRTHTPHPQPQAEQWKAYHSAWQNYYQKYYEAYYDHREKQVQATAEAQQQPSQAIGSLQTTQDDVSKDEALFELRQKLLGKVKNQAGKIRGSKHFLPIAAALSVVLIFVFLQYNRVLIGAVNAYVSPGSIDPQNIVIDPTASIAVGDESRLIIPKINVDVPAIYGIGADHASQMAAMEKGVAHFGIPGANSRPGEIGNTVLSGHSSNDLFDPGEYKFIFAQLDKLNEGDTIYANYGGVRYSYIVTKKEVVLPTQVDKLIYPTDKPILTLITCTPLGTAEKRLLITAEQISPDPAAAAAAPSGSGQVSNGSAAIPGNSPTLIERLFGAR